MQLFSSFGYVLVVITTVPVHSSPITAVKATVTNNTIVISKFFRPHVVHVDKQSMHIISIGVRTPQGRIQDLIRGGPQIVTGLKLPFWGLSFVEFWCWGLIFGGRGGPDPQGPPGSAPVPPQQDPFLSFLHTFLLKSVHVRGWHPPPMGRCPPQWEILDPPLIRVRPDWSSMDKMCPS